MKGLSGVFSGIDTETLIGQMLAISATPLNVFSARKTKATERLTALTAVEAQLTTLKTIANTLTDEGGLRAVNTSTSNSEILTISAGFGAMEGFHEIEIDQVAKTEQEVHKGLATADALLGAGVFAYQYDGQTISIQTGDATTLEDLRDRINSDSNNPGVIASILQYDDGAGGVYHLVLSGSKPGSDYGITIDGTTTLVDFQAGGGNWTQTQTAQDARIRIDGYPSGDWIERSNNSITDIIPNVTLNLQTPTDPGETVSITLTRDTSQLKNSLSNFLSAYNGLVTTIKGYTDYDPVTKIAGALSGESSIGAIPSRLRALMTAIPPGFSAGSDTFTWAEEIGLLFGGKDDDGNLVLDGQGRWDMDILDEALETDYDAVLAFIGAVGSGASDSQFLQFSSGMTGTQPGTYDVKVRFSDTGMITQAHFRLSGSTEWRTAQVDTETGKVIGRADTPEEGLEILAIWDGVSTEQTAEIRVRGGLASVLYNAAADYLASDTGILDSKRSRIEDQIENIDDSVERLEKRLADQEKRLRARFARMEVALAKLDSQRGAFDAMFASIEASNNKD